MEAEAEAGAVMVSEMVTEVEEPVRAEGGASVAVVTAVGATAAEGRAVAERVEVEKVAEVAAEMAAVEMVVEETGVVEMSEVVTAAEVTVVLRIVNASAS